ncbi:ABC transporter ATP-binding protein [Microvenator marinus]|uniref:ABC transporter ATP-binding protein n=1 Tax=Microvenator marinus TaxID=2600177 RepID=A0A5B8XTI4_9DELT|nr:ABC transporter ATP-binding protein [Microvenator marinus]QED26689.1 ABC transporter ATP-binding protein [Microvenator marinus]
MSLSLRQLHVQRGETHALKNLSLDIPSGARVLILGPNGAGKTTLLRAIAGLVTPKTGKIDVRGKIGWCSQHECLWPDLTPAEHLELFAELLGTSPLTRERLKSVDLETKSNAQVHTLSGGMRRRLSLALALLNNPEILLLDEPDAGLDADGQVKLANLLFAAAKDRTHTSFSCSTLRRVRASGFFAQASQNRFRKPWLWHLL